MKPFSPAPARRGGREQSMEKEKTAMITLRKRNGERFLVNHNQIECI